MDNIGLYQEPSRGDNLSRRFQDIRGATETLAGALTEEDQCIQSMPDASPAKWHRAHTTWFFEQFVLLPHVPDYQVFDPAFCFLFNSYYEAVGPRHPRPSRGLLTRPSAAQVTRYRHHVDTALQRAIPSLPPDVLAVVELGLHHEQQHLELLITDMLHAFAANPLFPAMIPNWREPLGTKPAGKKPPMGNATTGTETTGTETTGSATTSSATTSSATMFVECSAGLHRIGHAGIGHAGIGHAGNGHAGIGHEGNGFCFDNETPEHAAYLHPHAIAARLVRNRSWLDFIQDGGYRTSSLWMSDGWATVQSAGWAAPLHWREQDGEWFQFGPGGLVPLVPDAPVRHISWYEADAFARWSQARLPTEAEWEAASAHPDVHETTGHVWQWTESAYRPYPGYQAAPGAIGEYNGKFMINQMVLRGGSLATPQGHTRKTYRNFFHPDKRWQFTGLRLAKDL
jgi:formylglycine-generating enzyme required for sulfatase activity